MTWSNALPLAHLDDLTALKICELAAPISDELGVSLALMLGADRSARIVAARHRLYVAMWRANFSISEIGRLLGKDHTSVIHGLRKTMGPEQYKAGIVERQRSRVAS